MLPDALVDACDATFAAFTLSQSNSPPPGSLSVNRVFEKTLAYVQRFAGGLNATSASLIRQTCQERGLLEFETAAVTNLQPMNYDEAKTLIPTIEVEQRFTEEQVQELLEELQNVRQFEA